MSRQPETPRARLDKSFPVVDDYFAPVELSASRLNKLRAEVARSLNKTLEQCDVYREKRNAYLAHSKPWRLFAEHEGLRTYRRRHDTVVTARASQSFGVVEGNFLDIARFYRCETRGEFMAVQKHLNESTIDAMVLLNIAQHDDGLVAYEGVKWVAFRPSTLHLRMDVCYFETIGTGFHRDGKPFAFRIELPILSPEVPDLYDAKRLLRVYHKSVMVVSPSDRTVNSTEIFMTSLSDYKGNRVPQSFYKKSLVNLHRISSVIDNMRLSQIPPLARQTDPSERAPKCCTVCSRSFSLLRSKHRCGMCGEAVCRKCLGSVVDYKACTACLKSLREGFESPLPTPDPLSTHTEKWWKSHDLLLSHTMRDRPREDDDSDHAHTPVDRDAHEEHEPSSSRVQKHHYKDSFCSENSTSSFTSDLLSASPALVEGVYQDLDLDVPVLEGYEGGYRSDDEDDVLPMRRRMTLEIDTSEMTPVRSLSYHDSGLTTPVRCLSYNDSIFGRPRGISAASSQSSEAFETINSSIQEQEMLLRQLQFAIRASRA